MIKKILTFLVAAAALMSCSKHEPSKLVIDDVFKHKATISGKAYLNIFVNGNEEVNYVEEGTTLFFTAENKDLLADATKSGSYTTQATVGANGEYSVEFPTRADGSSVEVTISAGEFTIDNIISGKNKVTQHFKLDPAMSKSIDVIRDASYIKTVTFVGTTITESAMQEGWENGTYKFEDIKYSSKIDAFGATVEDKEVNDVTVKITIAKDQFVPERTEDYVAEGKINNGELSITLPAPLVSVNPDGLEFSVEGSFFAEQFDENGDDEIKKYDISFSGALYGGMKYPYNVEDESGVLPGTDL